MSRAIMLNSAIDNDIIITAKKLLDTLSLNDLCVNFFEVVVIGYCICKCTTCKDLIL